jgi:hypothetical protein
VGAQRTAIIDEDLARRFWPAYPNGQSPIGRHLLIGGVNPEPVEIIGIVADVHQNLEDNAWRETVYTSFVQNPQSNAMLAIARDGAPSSSSLQFAGKCKLWIAISRLWPSIR